MKTLRLLLLFWILSLPIIAHASHGMGADITYTCVGPNRFLITVAFYRDCSGTTASTTIPVTLRSASCGLTVNATLRRLACPTPVPPYSACEVTPLCPTYAARSCCVSTAASCLPGVQRYIYQDTVTLPRGCTDWVCTWTQCCRNSAITNLTTPASRDLRVECGINNVDTNCSNGPRFSTIPTPYICNGILYNYSHGAYDPDGDSLHYVLVDPLTGTGAVGAAISHVAPFTATSPLSTTGPFSFNSATGQMLFVPNGVQQVVITIRVEEYRDGVLVGYTMRDIQIVVLNSALCNTPNPVISAVSNVVNANAVDSTTVFVCPGSAASFDVLIWDPGSNNLTVSSNLSAFPSPIPGAFFSTTGSGDTILAHVTYTPTISDTGCGVFAINASNDGCPIEGNSSKVYTICVRRSVEVFPDSAIYCGDPIQLRATGGSVFSWAPSAGLSSSVILNPTATPSVSTMYRFTSDCGADSAFVQVKPLLPVDVGPNDTICRNGLANLLVTHPSMSPPYSYRWVPSTSLRDPVTGLFSDSIRDPVASPTSTTVYSCYVTDRDGCIRHDSMTLYVIGNAPVVQAAVDRDTVCPRDSVRLTAFSQPNTCGINPSSPCTGRDTLAAVITGPPGTVAVVQGGSTSQYPAIYGNFNKSARHQILYRASDLTRTIGHGGKIKSIAFEIATYYPPPTGTDTLYGFSIKMGCTNNDSLVNWIGGLQTVFTPKTIRANAGWNTHNFDFEYDWDGVSNLVVEVCFYNSVTSGRFNQKFRWHDTGYRTLLWNNNDLTQCNTNTVRTPTTDNYYRPNTRFSVCQTYLDSFLLTWTPYTGVNRVINYRDENAGSMPQYQQTYFVEINNSGCTSQDFLTVYVDTSVTLNAQPDTFLCSPRAVTLRAVTTGRAIGGGPLLYSWTSVPTDPTLTTPNAQFPVVTPTRTTRYYVVVSGGACTLRDSLDVSVGTNMPVGHTVKNISCWGRNDGQIRLSPSGTAPFHYSWSPAKPDTGFIINLSPGTYRVTVTDVSSCIGYDSIEVTQPDTLTISTLQTNIRCYGDSNSNAAVFVSGGSPNYHYVWSNGASGSPNVFGLRMGTYQVTVTDDSGCVKSTAFTITQPTRLTSVISSTPVSMAGGSDGTATVTPAGGTPPYHYNWSPGPLADASRVTGLSGGWYSVTITDTNGCRKIDSVFVYAPPPIRISYTQVNNTCFGQLNGSINVTVTGGYPSYRYSWSLGPGYTSNNVSGLPAGSYTFRVTDSLGTFKDTIITITQPTALTSYYDTVHVSCNGLSNGSATIHIAGGTAPYAYNWSSAGPPYTSILTGLSAGVYYTTVTDSFGCVLIDTVTVKQPALLTADVSGINHVRCFRQNNGTATVTASGGTPGYTYNWSGTGIGPATLNTLTAGFYTVTVQDINGCRATDTFSIYQPDSISLTSGKTDANCTTSRNGIAWVNASGGTGAFTYRWSDALSQTRDTATSLNGPGSFTVTVTDANLCTVSTTLSISTLYVVSLTLNSDSTKCYGANDGRAWVIASNGVYPYSYLWSAGSAITDSLNTGLAAGTYGVTVTDPAGCTASSTVPVHQPSDIILSTGFVAPRCTGSNDGKVWVVASGGSRVYSYLWNTSPPQNTDTAFALSQGSYTVTVTDSRGCYKTTTVNIIDPNPLIVSLNSKSSPTCYGYDDGKLSVSVRGGTSGYTYNWSNGANTSSLIDLGPGRYQLTVTDYNGCSVTWFEDLSYPPILTISAVRIDSVTCFGYSDGMLFPLGLGGTGMLHYSLDGINYQESPYLNRLPAGIHHIFVRDDNNCVYDTVVTIYEPAPLIVDIVPEDPTIDLGGSVRLTANIRPYGETSINRYTWNPIDGLSCSDCKSPVAGPYNETVYRVQVDYLAGHCIAEAFVTVKVNDAPDIYIPNAFTPNGDGSNDEFLVYGTGLKWVKMVIFDRWGEKVFESGLQATGWDGLYKGSELNPGVYVYHVDYEYLNGIRKEKVGSVTLIR